ncbi:internal scaffolding protein [Apis mellifera associated microvirus 8]|nr:internal scaffolding protein [Apis mellifera associated microvirus 8]
MKKIPEFRTPYNDNYVDPGYQKFDDKGEPVDAFGNPDPSLTVQSERDDTDINVIVDRYQKTGLLPANLATPQWGVDVSDAPSYQQAVQVVIDAERMFGSLDAKIRKEFDNDPAKFLAFVDDPANADKLIEMGLREAPPAPSEPISVRVLQDPAQDATASS